MKLLVCGTGAMGSLFSGLFSASGHDVTVLGTWDAALERISSKGLRLFRGDELLFQTQPLRVIRAASGSVGYDLVLVMVKTYQTAGLLPRLSGLRSEIPILTFQNGFGNKEVISTGLKNNVLAGVTNIGATLIDPGVVKWVGDGGTTLPDESVLRLIFGQSWRFPIKTSFVINTDQAIWDKLLINAAINPITAIYSVKNGELLREGKARDRMRSIATECAVVGNMIGMVTDLEGVLERLDVVLKATADNRSSMLSDVFRGSLTEIDSITGAVIKVGRSVGVATPENERVYTEVKALGG